MAPPLVFAVMEMLEPLAEALASEPALMAEARALATEADELPCP